MRLLCLCAIFLLSHQSIWGYKVAVYEYHPQSGSNATETIELNIEQYQSFADQADKQNVDIMVFPEYGLTTIEANPEEAAISLDHEIITRLKNLAHEHALYLVVNLLEKEQIANEATKYFSTNLVFDRSGNIILKYRKINLYNEPKLTAGDPKQDLTFSTDFGTTFGILTSSDIFFENPSRRLLENSDVVAVVYPTAWKSVAPFFTSLSVQHGYALASGVDLLAANYGDPKKGLGGSGIYLDNNDIQTYIYDSPSSKPLVVDVKTTSRKDITKCVSVTPFGLPGNPDRLNVTNYNTDRDFEASKYTFKTVDLTTKAQQLEVCNNGFCCNFKLIVAATNSTDHYKVIAYKGYDKIIKDHVRICSLVACKDDSNESCGERFEPETSFTKVEVKTFLKKGDKHVYTPISTSTYLLPAKPVTYCRQDVNSTTTTEIQYSSLKTQQKLLAFGIFGKSSASTLQGFSIMVLVLGWVLKNTL